MQKKTKKIKKIDYHLHPVIIHYKYIMNLHSISETERVSRIVVVILSQLLNENQNKESKKLQEKETKFNFRVFFLNDITVAVN